MGSFSYFFFRSPVLIPVFRIDSLWANKWKKTERGIYIYQGDHSPRFWKEVGRKFLPNEFWKEYKEYF